MLNTVVMLRLAESFEITTFWYLSTLRYGAEWTEFCEPTKWTDTKKSMTPAFYARCFVGKIAYLRYFVAFLELTEDKRTY